MDATEGCTEGCKPRTGVLATGRRKQNRGQGSPQHGGEGEEVSRPELPQIFPGATQSRWEQGAEPWEGFFSRS